jgi:hypothetical protein
MTISYQAVNGSRHDEIRTPGAQITTDSLAKRLICPA